MAAMHLNGFLAGARSINTDIEVSYGVVEDDTAEVATEKLAINMYNAGIDCVSHCTLTDGVQKALVLVNQTDLYSQGYMHNAHIWYGRSVVSSTKLQMNTVYNKIFEQFLANGSLTPNRGFLPTTYNVRPINPITALSDEVPPTNRKLVTNTYLNMRVNTTYDKVLCALTPYYPDPPLDENGCVTPEYIISATSYSTELHFFNSLSRENATTQYYPEAKQAFVIVNMVLTSLLILCCIISIIDVAVNHEIRIYKASSPVFCILILSGLVLMLISNYLWIGIPTLATCNTRYFLGGIGYTVVFSCILAKNYRIVSIWNTKSVRGKTHLDRELIVKFVLTLSLVELLICFIWVFVLPLNPIVQPNTLTLPGYDEVEVRCISSSPALLAIWLVYKALLLIPAAVISWKTRTVRGDYRESQGIAIAVYNTALAGLLVIGLSFILSGYVAEYVVITYGVCIIVCVIYFVIFGSKFWRIHFMEDGFKARPTFTNKSTSNQEFGSSAGNNGGSFGHGGSTPQLRNFSFQYRGPAREVSETSDSSCQTE